MPGHTLPSMESLVCPTMESARAQANALSRAGQRDFNPSAVPTWIIAPCQVIQATVTPLHLDNSIPAFVAWQDSFDPAGHFTANVAPDGRLISVPTQIVRKTVEVYRSSFTDAAGGSYHGWAFIPNSPYGIEYLRQVNRWP